jgi:hypothetical protein
VPTRKPKPSPMRKTTQAIRQAQGRALHKRNASKRKHDAAQRTYQRRRPRFPSLIHNVKEQVKSRRKTPKGPATNRPPGPRHTGTSNFHCETQPLLIPPSPSVIKLYQSLDGSPAGRGARPVLHWIGRVSAGEGSPWDC